MAGLTDLLTGANEARYTGWRGGARRGRMVGIPAAHDRTSTSLDGRGINWVSYLYKNGGESPKGLEDDRKHFFHEVSGIVAAGSALLQVMLGPPPRPTPALCGPRTRKTKLSKNYTNVITW